MVLGTRLGRIKRQPEVGLGTRLGRIKRQPEVGLGTRLGRIKRQPEVGLGTRLYSKEMTHSRLQFEIGASSRQTRVVWHASLSLTHAPRCGKGYTKTIHIISSVAGNSTTNQKLAL